MSGHQASSYLKNGPFSTSLSSVHYGLLFSLKKTSGYIGFVLKSLISSINSNNSNATYIFERVSKHSQVFVGS